MRGKSAQDLQMPASFTFDSSSNYIEGNVAAGSDRLGYFLPGLPCSGLGSNGQGYTFLNNVVHSSVAGVWLKSSTASQAVGCTEIANLTAYLTWDFGLITTTVSYMADD